MKIRTIIIIDNDVDLYGETPDDYVKLTQAQLTSGDLPVDELIEMSNDTTIVTIKMEP